MEEVTKVIMTTLSKLLAFEDNLLFQSDDYKYQVEILKSRLDNFQEEGCIHGQCGSSITMKTLEKAEAELKRVELRLSSLQNLASGSHCCSYIWLWYAKLSIVLFPENVEKILEKVNEDIDKLLKVLKEKGEIHNQRRASDNRQPIVATVNDIDRLYVPIDKPHSAVMKAIKHLQGPRVILLHGGVGKGKSTLARSMIQHYGKAEENGGMRSIEKGNKSDTTDGEGFDRVVWVSCGNCSQDDISSKQLEILQDHSPKTFGDSPSEAKMSPKRRISKDLQQFCCEKKILVILDDVTDHRFLYEMWKATTGGKASTDGKGVKILVTSQWANICAIAGLVKDSCCIFMEDPTEGEAMKILGSLVGLERQCIPPNLQHTAKEMIKATERNPLALACLASHFVYSKEKGDQHAWQDALRGLQTLLENPEEKIVLPVSVTGKHSDPRSLCGAMKICIDSLRTGDAKKILFLMYAFKEESAPELVLRVLHGSLKKKSTFGKSRDELNMRELLKIHQQPLQPTRLSLRSLVKLYMEQTKMVSRNEIKSLMDELVPNREQEPESSSVEIKPEDEVDTVEWEKARVAVTLCALYFDLHPRVNKIVTDAISRASITYSNDGINELRRQAIYPVLALLDMPEDEHWKESDISSARQVFLTYICKHELDDKSISHLLDLAAFTTAPLATLKAVGQICRIEKVSLLKDNSINFLQAILQLLDLRTGLPMSLIEAASSALGLVCWKAAQDQSTSLVISTPGLLTNLVKCLSEHDNPHLQRAATGALANLACNPNRSDTFRIFNQEGAIHNLVNLVCSHETPSDVQQYATLVFRNLGGANLKFPIVNANRAAEGLLKILSMNDQPNTQAYAAAALANVTFTADRSAKLQIVNQEGALHSLVNVISSQKTPGDVQEYATAVVRELATVEDDVVKLRIINEDRAIQCLVKLLSMHDKPTTQAHAAAALANVAATADTSVKLQIVNQEGALHSLVKLISSHETPGDVQESATLAVRNLATAEDDVVKLRIINEDGAIEGLVKLLSMNIKPKTQVHAAVALANVAANANTSVKLQIVNQEGALHSLVKLISSHETPSNVQEYATVVVANLASVEDDVVKLRIAEEEGAVLGLLKCLAVHDRPVLQRFARLAFCHLVEFDEVKAVLKGTAGLLNGLSSLLADGIAVNTQYIAARALTLINPTLGKEASLTSGKAYWGRAHAFIVMGMFEEALRDLELAVDAVQGADYHINVLCNRCFVKVKVGDLDGALDDANVAVKVSHNDERCFALQERGVLKQMLGDLKGSLADLDEAWKIDNEDYEVLKQRGLVRFLLRDEEGARADAEWALRIKPPRVDRRDYGGRCLGTTPVEYLGYKLK